MCSALGTREAQRGQYSSTRLSLTCSSKLCLSLLSDAVAYAALLRNELLGAGIESVPDPHTDERRHAVLSQDSHSLFRV